MRALRLVGLVLVAAFVLVLGGSLVAGLTGSRAPRSTPVVARTDSPHVTVEVLNAAGRPGLARSVTRRLRAAGFDVVYFGNAHSFGQDTSLVIDRVGKPEAAHRVAEALGVGRVVSRRDSTLYVDVTLVVGRDYHGAAGAAPADTTGP